MVLSFSQYRVSGSDEIAVTVGRLTAGLTPIDTYKHSESIEINSIKVEIIDNKPLYIPLGKSTLDYKIQFKTFALKDFDSWYTVLGNDVLKVEESTYPEFNVGTYWNVESMSIHELMGSAYAKVNAEISDVIPGEQGIIVDYELAVSQSLMDALGRPRV